MKKEAALEGATPKRFNVRAMTVTAMLAALSAALQYLEFPIPFVPPFLKMDLSDFPSLIAAYCFGPVSGVCVCFIKNAVHLTASYSGGVGELSNFLLGALFVIPAGLMYKKHKTRGYALAGAAVGAVIMSLGSVVTNYFLVYPVYYKVAMPEAAILDMYKAILPSVDSIFECLWIFNVPFTFARALISVLLVFPIYKYISPLLKGYK